MFERKNLTIAIEGPQLRLMTTKGSQVDRWEQTTLPDGVIEAGVIRNSAAIGARLGELIEAHSMPTRRVICSIPGHRAIFRTFALPPMEEQLIDGAVRRKVRQEIPMPEGEMDLTWSILERTEETLVVFVVAIPRSLIDAHVAILQEAGLRPRAMDVTPMALMRAANRENGIVADLEDHGLTVIIVQERRPSIVRTVPLGGEAIPPEGRLELLIQELNRTTKFYNESHKREPLPEDTVVTASGSSFTDGAMLERFAARISFPVSLADPPLVYPEEFPLAQYGVNIGLALKNV